MKITGLEAAVYSAPYERPIANGKYTYASTDVALAAVSTDEGITGYGWTSGGTIAVVFHTLESLREKIVGEDPFNVERIWEKMYQPKVYGRRGLTTRAISAVDIALWDIKGKAAGRSIWQLLGGYQPSIAAYIAGGYYEKDKIHSGLQQEMKDNVSRGAKAVKMKIGGASIRTDIERIDAVRDAVGPGIGLLVDANNAYNRPDALKMGRELDRRDIYWFEEPLSPDDLEGCAELRKKLDTPIAIGENEYTRWGFKQILDTGAAQIINADAQVLGGITEWKKVADMAAASHVLVAPHGDQEIHAHLVCAVPNGIIAEYYDTNTNALLKAMFKSPVKLGSRGEITPRGGSGIGTNPDVEALERFRILKTPEN
jgi:D-arabinonate dehydratase